MARLSLAAAVAALVSVVAGQDDTPSALPEATAPAGMACGGCMVVADVAGILFGTPATATQTNVVVTGNGTQAVVTQAPTSIVVPQGKATFVDGSPLGPGIVTSFGTGTVITVNGATLTSPTSYELFTAYSVMSTVSSGSGCSVSSGTPVLLPQASRYEIPSNAPSDYLLSLESQFIKDIGIPSCSAGGSNVQSTLHLPVSVTTESVTTDMRPTAAPASTSAAASASATYVVPNVTINPAFPSITPAANGGERTATWGSAAALVVALGVLAVWL